MRVSTKVSENSNLESLGKVTRVYYDGQMPVEEGFTDADVPASNKVTKTFVGALVFEAMTTKVSSGSPTRAYPLYDAY